MLIIRFWKTSYQTADGKAVLQKTEMGRISVCGAMEWPVRRPKEDIAMWSSDSILGEILSPIFLEGSPFQPLPAQIEREDAGSPKSLSEGFKRLFGCKEAREAWNVAFIWALDQPYHHSDGSLSTVVYIEKTKRSIFLRWSPHIRCLVTGAPIEKPMDSQDLRELANHDTLRFYSTIIAAYGPLRVWWADVDHLNEASHRKLDRALDWERLLLTSYLERYHCSPLKNRCRLSCRPFHSAAILPTVA
jgi:hypothetical protein